jgi:hypothetical protein
MLAREDDPVIRRAIERERFRFQQRKTRLRYLEGIARDAGKDRLADKYLLKQLEMEKSQ